MGPQVNGERRISQRSHSQVPSSKMDKGVLTEEQNLGLPDGQTDKLTPQPGQGAISISAQQDLCTREIIGIFTLANVSS